MKNSLMKKAKIDEPLVTIVVTVWMVYWKRRYEL